MHIEKIKEFTEKDLREDYYTTPVPEGYQIIVDGARRIIKVEKRIKCKDFYKTIYPTHAIEPITENCFKLIEGWKFRNIKSVKMLMDANYFVAAALGQSPRTHWIANIKTTGEIRNPDLRVYYRTPTMKRWLKFYHQKTTEPPYTMVEINEGLLVYQSDVIYFVLVDEKRMTIVDYYIVNKPPHISTIRILLTDLGYKHSDNIEINSKKK